MNLERDELAGQLKSRAFFVRPLLLRSYRGRVLLVAFLGVHAPLVALIVYLALVGYPVGTGNVLAIILVALAATLLGTAATLYALNRILIPVSLASQALRDYVEHGATPDFPIGFADRGGRLMADLEYTVEQAERMRRAMQILEDLSLRDHLTGAYNRRGCEERLGEDLARLRRGGGVLTLAVLDVDRFKSINDEYGHQAGDACLTHVAATMESIVRRGDWLARWGGDEFVLALWDAEPSSSAETVLERVLDAIRSVPARLPDGSQVQLSLSGGAYRCTGGEDARRCFSLADDALRRAKREGRSRVIYEA